MQISDIRESREPLPCGGEIGVLKPDIHADASPRPEVSVYKTLISTQG